jgi:hypothetical protein
LYAIVRRIELTKYVLNKKSFHPQAQKLSIIKALVLVLFGHETEICNFCGSKVEYIWWSDDYLWKILTGYKNGEGISCMKCFEKLAQKHKLLIRWVATEL